MDFVVVTEEMKEKTASEISSTHGFLEALQKARENANSDPDAEWNDHIRNVLLMIAAKEMEVLAFRLRNGPIFQRDETVAVRFAEILWTDLEFEKVESEMSGTVDQNGKRDEVASLADRRL